MKVYTIGFHRKSAQRFFDLLRNSGAERVIDVRLYNTSQLAGFAKRDDLAWFLRKLCRLDYAHLPELAPTQELFDAPRSDDARREEVERSFVALLKRRRVETTLKRQSVAGACLLGSEADPRRCHRRLVAEYLQKRWKGVEIVHLV
jgi:uncharacterized protein (DUF488 family)